MTTNSQMNEEREGSSSQSNQKNKTKSAKKSIRHPEEKPLLEHNEKYSEET